MENKKRIGGKALLISALSMLSHENVLNTQEKKEPSANRQSLVCSTHSSGGCPVPAGTPIWSLLGAMYF